MTKRLELSIIKSLISSKKNLKYLKYTSSLEEEYIRIFKVIQKYYDNYQSHEYLSADELETYFFTEYPQIKNKEAYTQIFSEVRKLDISESVAVEVIRRMLARQTAEKVVDHLMPVLGGEQPERLREVIEYIQDYTSEAENVDSIKNPYIIDISFEDLISSQITAPGLEWKLPCLNESIGPLRRGTLGHIFARPDAGKTSLICSEISHMLPQVEDGEYIVGVYNEDVGLRIQLRFIESLLGMTQEEVKNADPVYLRALYNAAGGDKLILHYKTDTTMEDIQNLLETHNTRLLIVDLADHVQFRDKPTQKHEYLEELYRRFRVLAGRYNVDIITSGQADAQCSGRKILQLENMNNSKVGKQGALDYAIGIGKTYDPAEADLRWISIVKNKLKSEDGGPYTVGIDKATGRYYPV